ncbi:MAG: hypothetical protein ABH873_07310 [Candidatus Firestonebacteria bacterium]
MTDEYTKIMLTVMAILLFLIFIRMPQLPTTDVICFVIGPFLVLLAMPYSHRSYRDDSDFTFLFALGVSLICLGFLRIYWNRNKKV